MRKCLRVRGPETPGRRQASAASRGLRSRYGAGLPPFRGPEMSQPSSERPEQGGRPVLSRGIS